MTHEPQQTPITNEQFDLVSALYHLMEGSQTYGTYIKDAEQANDQEVVQCLRDMKQQSEKDIEKLRGLVAQRLSKSGQPSQM